MEKMQKNQNTWEPNQSSCDYGYETRKKKSEGLTRTMNPKLSGGGK
jgi:hypothetical protein